MFTYLSKKWLKHICWVSLITRFILGRNLVSMSNNISDTKVSSTERKHIRIHPSLRPALPTSPRWLLVSHIHYFFRFSVVLGEHNIETKIDCTPGGTFCADPIQTRKISKVITHPDYNPDNVAHYNDIAIIYLKKRALFSGALISALLT